MREDQFIGRVGWLSAFIVWSWADWALVWIPGALLAGVVVAGIVLNAKRRAERGER